MTQIVISGCSTAFKATSVQLQLTHQPKRWAQSERHTITNTFLHPEKRFQLDLHAKAQTKIHKVVESWKGYPFGFALTSRASRVTNPVMENPSMMSSSAEVDSFRFLRGGLGRDEQGSLSPSRSESEEKRKTEPLTWLFLIPFDLLSRSLADLDFLFLRRPLDRGPSMSFIGNIQINPPLTENETLQGPNTGTAWPPLVWNPTLENLHDIQVNVINMLDPR